MVVLLLGLWLLLGCDNIDKKVKNDEKVLKDEKIPQNDSIDSNITRANKSDMYIKTTNDIELEYGIKRMKSEAKMMKIKNIKMKNNDENIKSPEIKGKIKRLKLVKKPEIKILSHYEHYNYMKLILDENKKLDENVVKNVDYIDEKSKNEKIRSFLTKNKTNIVAKSEFESKSADKTGSKNGRSQDYNRVDGENKLDVVIGQSRDVEEKSSILRAKQPKISTFMKKKNIERSL